MDLDGRRDAKHPLDRDQENCDIAILKSHFHGSHARRRCTRFAQGTTYSVCKQDYYHGRVPSYLDEESLKFERIIHHFLKFDVDTGRTYSTKRHSERGVKKETRETSVESGVTENTGHRVVDVY